MVLEIICATIGAVWNLAILFRLLQLIVYKLKKDR